MADIADYFKPSVLPIPGWDGQGIYIEPLIQFATEYQPKKVLEIGLGHWGYSTRVWLEYSDAYVRTIDKGDWKGVGAELTRRYPTRFKFTKGLTQEVLPDLEPVYDLIFIDGDHSYAGARADILDCQKLVKPGGIILLDDIDVPFMSAVNVDERGEPLDGMFGVGEAVVDTLGDWPQAYEHIAFANGGRAYRCV